MKKSTLSLVGSHVSPGNILLNLLKEGARKMLAHAIEVEVDDYISAHSIAVDEDGHRLVVRNGRMPRRSIQTAVGHIEIAQPRVNDRRVDANGNRKQFRSKILPPYLRRTNDLEELIPWLYLKGISTGDFTNALSALVGTDAKGLSPSTVVRLKEDWMIEYRNWAKRSLKEKNYLYVWADGVYFNVRLDGERCCVLVLIGVTEDGHKELLAVEDGVRESEISWTQILVDVKKRGLTKGPQLVIGDGALGFWKAAEKIYPKARHQRCWVHKTANILNKLPLLRSTPNGTFLTHPFHV